MARRQKRRRPIIGGATLGALIAFLFFVLELGVTFAILPWTVLGAAVGGGMLGTTVRDAAGDAGLAGILEAFLSALGQVFGAIFGFFGDLFSGFST